MYNGDIIFRGEKISSEYVITLLEKTFLFQDKGWKREVDVRAKETINYNICVKIDSFEKILSNAILNNSEKILVKKVSTNIVAEEGKKELILYLKTE